ncbi:YceI family protein [Flavobacteriaceae bacterium MHTCC 0001]
MKTLIKKSAAAILVAFLTLSFTKTSIKKEIKIDSSTLVWKAYKVTGSHEGTVAIKSGYLNFEDDKLTGGEFVIDMTTIANTDIKGEYSAKLDGHLKSDDFFGVEKFPTSSLVFTKVTPVSKNAYEVTGDISIKGKTESITFNLSVYGNKANAALKIDRTKFDIKYGSSSFFDGLKDKAIYDEFDLIADLEF